jgi:hypothetical protein
MNNKPKFNPQEDIVILNFLMNGTRIDARGKYIGTVRRGQFQGCAHVQIGGIPIFVPAERLVKWDEYFPEGNNNNHD